MFVPRAALPYEVDENAMIATSFDSAAIHVSRIIDRSMKLNYVMRFYSDSLKVST